MPVERFTRVVLTTELVLSLLVAAPLTLLPTHTDDAFAWTIALPLTAAFLGAGYVAAALAVVPTYRMRDWREVRVVVVMAFTLTFVMLLVTLARLGDFHLGAGSMTGRLVGWSWLVVYVAVPLLLAAVFVRQERRRARVPRDPAAPLLGSTRRLLAVEATVAGVLGLGLALPPGRFDVTWPWPLPPLAAGAVGAWLLTVASGAAWTLRERDWACGRFVQRAVGVYLVLVLLTCARYSGSFDGSAWQTWTFFGAIGLWGLAHAVATRRQRAALAPAAAPAAAA